MSQHEIDSHHEAKLEVEDRLLDAAVAAVRADAPDPAATQQAGARAWSRVEAEVKSADPYGASSTNRARPGFSVPPTLADRPATPLARRLLGSRKARFAVAAAFAAALALGLFSFGDRIRIGGTVGAVHATEGGLVRLTGSNVQPLVAGDSLASGTSLRTGPGSGATLSLPDGSQVEMDQRAEIRLDRTLRGLRLRVVRGRVLVRDVDGSVASSTPDGTAVDGTAAYAVNRGVLGTRVTLLDGEAQLEDPSGTRTLVAGQQFTSGDHLQPGSFGAEIAWSTDADRYAELVAAVDAAGTQVRQALEQAPVRTASDLSARAPRNTVIYAAFPNVAADIMAAQRRLFDTLRQDPRLTGELADPDTDTTAQIDAMGAFLDAVESAAGTLGNEIAIAWVRNPGADSDGSLTPVLLAKASDPDQAQARLNALADQMNDTAGSPVVAWLGGSSDAEFTLSLKDGVLAASTDEALVARVADGGEGLEGEFAAAVAAAYARGVSWLGAADIEALSPWPDPDSEADRSNMMLQSGLLDANYLIVEQRQDEGRAVLSFTGPRRGMAAWLAEPSPVGALDFVSGDASLAGAFASQDGVEMFDDVLGILGVGRPEVPSELGGLEADLGIDVRDDLAASVGGEVAFALDGTVLPEPAWKVIVEVIDPDRLQTALEALVQRTADDGKAISIHSEESGGRTYYRIVVSGQDRAVYTFADGYLLAAPRRELVDRALRYRADGFTLERSAQFRALLPTDAHPNFSALWYQNLGPVVEPLASAGELAAADSAAGAVAAMSSVLAPSLSVAYAGPDQITIASRGGDGPFGLDLAGLMSSTQTMTLDALAQPADGSR